MSEVRIVAESRTEFGKGFARRTRMAGQVPAVLYGHGLPVRHVSLPARELMHAFRGGANVLLTLEIGGDTQLALPKAVVRHPLKGTFTHLDLLAVRQGERVVVDIQLHITGEITDKSGVVDQPQTTLSVEVEATHIPASFEVAIDALTIGDSIHASQVVLPEGVILLTDPEAVVVHVLAPQSAEDGAEGAEPETDAEAGDGAAGDGDAAEVTEG